MSGIKFPLAGESKLAKTVARISQKEALSKSGFVTAIDKTTSYKTKSFRLRESDHINLSNVVKEINKLSDRKNFSESEIIRGIINCIADNIDSNCKKVLEYIIKSS